ncbi:MATE family efflux transporter, partial [Oleiphilus sp. HI0066]|uniref:MATE family efflux transporter n=1 Tax=Oleiphilus sp. HI0066 TaxID=1822242 RepID=UPI000B28E531
FIFTFDLGLAGAAWATLCSFSIGCLFVYPFILKKNWLHFSDAFENAIEKIKQILAVALPAMTSQLLPALSSMLATMLVAQHGTESVAAWGLGIRVEFFSIILVLAMTMSLPPMIGKSYGAKNFDDIQILLKLAVKTIIAWQLLLALILVLFDSSISHALAGNEDIASLLALYIVIIPFSYAFLGICMVLVSAANAISRAMDGLKISFARLFICYLPCLFIGSVFGDLMVLMIGSAVGNVLAGIIS